MDLNYFKREFEHLSRETRTPLSTVNKPRPKSILLGHNAITGERVCITEDDRKVHEHIIGSSGTGKSKLLELQIRADIDNRNGLILIDPVGDLYDAVLNYIARYKLGHKVIIIDPNNDDWAVGINCLEFDDTIRSSTSHTAEVMKGISKVFNDEQLDSMPQLQRWERDAIVALVEAKQTIVELGPFMRQAYIRQIILRSVDNNEVKEEWDSFNSLTKSTKETYSRAIFNRANKFAIGQNVRRIFGQVNSTIDFRKAMDEGKIILCNLARKKISAEEQKMLGIVLLDKIVQAGLSRVDIAPERRKPFYVYFDEFGLFVNYDIAIALWELRKFNVRFILSHQELAQLDDERVLSAVLNEPQIKIAFRTGRENAEKMMLEMFSGQIRGDKVKFDLYTESEFHRETTRTIKGHSATHSEGTVRGTGTAAGETQIPLLLEDKTVSLFTNASELDSASSSDGYAETETEVPFLEPFIKKQLTGRQFYSVEEVKEKLISWIQAQPDRHAQVKIRQNKTVPIITPDVSSQAKLISYLVPYPRMTISTYSTR